MVWLWYVAPIAIGLVYVLTGLWPDRRRSYEVQRWRAGFRSAAPPPPKKKGEKGSSKAADVGPREVTSLPGELARMVEEAGGGAALAYYELYPKLAYLAEMAADAMTASDHHTVVARLAKPGPTFTVRPLPIVEGARVENTGVKFPKDPEFMQLFLVEGEDARAIGKWLKRSMRNALSMYPDLWLHVRGRTMAVSLFGPADADQIDDLIAVADEIFAEVGADGAPSLLGEEDGDDDEDEDDLDDEDEDDLDDEDDEGDDETDETDETDEDDAEEEEKAQPKAAPVKTASATPKKTAAAATAKPSGASSKTGAKSSTEPVKTKTATPAKAAAKPGSSAATTSTTKSSGK